VTAATDNTFLRAMSSPDAEGGTRAHYRPEIQGLRAVAVLLVVLFHLWPRRVMGGYVGVDVFFVISGFLITSHLVREAEERGTVRLGLFWARRLRRLLPASFVVLAASAIALVLVLPSTLWTTAASQIAASALYVQNWALASDAVDYLAADNDPSVVEHYWSLSVEEQFYLLWPLLLLAAVTLHRWVPRLTLRTTALATIGLLTAASLVVSVQLTATDQAYAYFATHARAWEFGVGALLAILRPLTGQRRWYAPAATAGLGVILAAGFAFDGTTAFPGWMAAFPVLGAAAVIAAGQQGGPVARVLSMRPATALGDLSYGIYLWHWPLIVVAPYAVGRALAWPDKLAILLLSVGLAQVVKSLVEDPMRRSREVRVPWVLGFAALGSAMLVMGSALINDEVERRASAREPASASDQLCHGPRALDVDAECDSVTGTGAYWPALEAVVLQNTDVTYPGCQANAISDDVVRCELGAEPSSSTRVVAVVGDSHATMWFAALDQLGSERGWSVVTYTRSSCPFTLARRTQANETDAGNQERCHHWIGEVVENLVATEGLTHVFTAARSAAYGYDPGSLDVDDPRVDGFLAAWQPLIHRDVSVVAIADVPWTVDEIVPTCLARNEPDRLACAVPRTTALRGSAVVDAARRLPDGRGHVIDLTDRFCDADMCYPVVGDVVVYRDASHIAHDYVLALVPYLADALGDAGLS
jgi:peptidoglycan/LPS O-acetylase OafA/YrhL